MNKKLVAAIAAVTVAGGLLVSGTASSATSPPPGLAYMATMGGSQATVLGQTVTSDLTAQSRIQGASYPAAQENTVASAHVGSVVSLGAVSTAVAAKKVTGGAEVTALGETAGVNLLNGLVKIDAVKSTVTTDFVNGVATGSAHTTFVGLHVLGANIPIDVPENYTINIGNIAVLRLNNVNVQNVPSGVAVFASALDLTLLTPRAGGGAGTEIILNPSQVDNVLMVPVGPQVLNGVAYASHVSVVVPHVAAAESGYTAELVQPRAGTAGQWVYNRTARVYIPKVLEVGAIGTSQKGTASPTLGQLTESYEIGKINVLNGLVTADAIEGSASEQRLGDGSYVPTIESKFINLTIAGHAIPINVSPNTVINVLGLATIEINKQATSAQASAVFGITVTLTVAKYGLPVGAVINVGVAIAGINLTA